MLARSAIAPRRKNAPRPAWRVAEAFRQWLRGRPCACGGSFSGCGGAMVAAHVDHAGGKGTGVKVADKHNIPLTRNCHHEQHRIGWRSFEAAYLPGGDAVALAAEYWSRWPGRAAWERENGQ